MSSALSHQSHGVHSYHALLAFLHILCILMVYAIIISLVTYSYFYHLLRRIKSQKLPEEQTALLIVMHTGNREPWKLSHEIEKWTVQLQNHRYKDLNRCQLQLGSEGTNSLSLQGNRQFCIFVWQLVGIITSLDCKKKNKLQAVHMVD